jgi:glucose/arabinose dehydrogenase
MTMKWEKAGLLFTLASVAAWAQANIGEQKPEPSLPFTMSTVATFELPWRIAFLPDGRMLVTEKIGPIWLVAQDGQETVVNNTPAVYWQGQSGMFGVFLSPNYDSDKSTYLTYSEPGDYGGGLVLARAKLNTAGPGGPNTTGPVARLENLQVLWRQLPKGKGGQEGAQIAFAPDGKSLFVTVGDRMRFTPRRIPTSPKARSCT